MIGYLTLAVSFPVDTATANSQQENDYTLVNALCVVTRALKVQGKYLTKKRLYTSLYHIRLRCALYPVIASIYR